MALKIADFFSVEGFIFTNDPGDQQFCDARRFAFDIMRNLYCYKGRDVSTVCGKRRAMACQFNGVISRNDYLELLALLDGLEFNLTVIAELDAAEAAEEARRYAQSMDDFKAELKKFSQLMENDAAEAAEEARRYAQRMENFKAELNQLCRKLNLEGGLTND